VAIPEPEPVTERLQVREIDDDEGRRLVRIIRRGSGSVVTWRRAQMVLLAARGMDVAAIAKVAFTSEDRVRDVIRNFSADGSLVPEGVVDDISHEGLRVLLREEGVTFQRLKTWKASKDPRYAEKKVRVEQLYAIADREAAPENGDPEVIFCVDEFGPLNLQPRRGRQ
jgi:hypothetical protein